MVAARPAKPGQQGQTARFEGLGLASQHSMAPHIWECLDSKAPPALLGSLFSRRRCMTRARRIQLPEELLTSCCKFALRLGSSAS